MNVVAREGSELSFEITELEVAFKQVAVLQGLMSPFDLALSLGVIRRPTRMLHAVVAKKTPLLCRKLVSNTSDEPASSEIPKLYRLLALNAASVMPPSPITVVDAPKLMPVMPPLLAKNKSDTVAPGSASVVVLK